MSEELDNKRVYSAYADKIFDKRYNSPHPLRRYVHRAQYQSIINQIQHGESVLDVGCGEGVLACLLALKGIRVTGVDISEPNIAAARELAERMGVSQLVQFMVGDAENVPLPDESYDTVVSCHVLEHLPHFDKGLRELYRLSRKKVIVALPTLLNMCSMVQVGHGSFWEISRRSLVAFPLGIVKTITHIFGEGIDEGYGGNKELIHIFRYPWIMHKKLTTGGFTIEHFEASTLALPFFSFLLPFIRLLDRTKTWPLFRNFGYGSTAVLQKK